MSRSLTNCQNHPDRCTNYKKEDHTRDQCLFLYPHLGPKGWKVVEKKRMEESNGCASRSNGYGDQMLQFLQKLIVWLANQNQSPTKILYQQKKNIDYLRVLVVMLC